MKFKWNLEKLRKSQRKLINIVLIEGRLGPESGLRTTDQGVTDETNLKKWERSISGKTSSTVHFLDHMLNLHLDVRKFWFENEDQRQLQLIFQNYLK